MTEDNKNRKAASVKKPNPIFYHFVRACFLIAAKILYRFKICRDPRIKKLKGPVVAVATHSCIMDVAFMVNALGARRYNLVVGRDVVSWGFVKKFNKAINLIPISQVTVDLGSIRLMKKAVDDGCSLLLFPEGKISIDGRNLHYIGKSLAKLLKLFDANVVFSHNYGGFTGKPRWHRSFKFGKIVNKTELLYTREELAAASVEEVDKVLHEKFSFNDNIYQQENKLRFKCKDPAQGITYILYKCPKCGAEYELSADDGRHIVCAECGNTVEYTEYGEFIPAEGSVAIDRIDKWFDYERESVRREIENPDFKLSYPATWERADQNFNYVETGDGECFVDLDYIGFVGTRYSDGSPVEIKVPLRNLYTIVHKNQEAVDLTIDGVVNRFYFKAGKYSVKYNIVVEELFQKNLKS